MKKIFLLPMMCLFVFATFAQTNEEQAVSETILAVHKAIFLNKDSAALENLIGKELSYGHSAGKVENRSEMIKAVANSKSTYTNLDAKVLSVNIQGKTAVSRYLLTGTETKLDGKSTELKLNILQVWLKEKKSWKLIARQAVKVS